MLTKFNVKTDGGKGLADLGPVIQELRGLTVSIGTGATAGTKVAVAGIRAEDTLVSVVRSAAGVLTDVTANYSISDTKATGTLTVAAAVANDTVAVDGVTFTGKAAPTSVTEFKIGANNTETGANLAAALNAYQIRYNGTRQGKATYKATAAAGVVTLTAIADGVAGNAIALAGTAVRLAASAATLTGGTATGGVVSNADHSATSSLMITWFNKQ